MADEVTSLKEFINKVQDLDKKRSGDWLYRGGKTYRDVTDLWPTLLQNKAFYDWTKHDELALNPIHYSRQPPPHGVEKDSLADNAFQVEHYLITEFMRRATPYLANVPQTKLEWMALARHHGLGSRLLDWSKNPLVALWFAVQDDRSLVNDAVVYAYLPEPEKYFTNQLEGIDYSPPAPVVVESRVFFPRVQAQTSVFTLHPYDVNFGFKSQSNFTTTRILQRYRWDIRRDLMVLGINAEFVFPDLDGLCKTINWRRTSDKDSPRKADGSGDNKLYDGAYVCPKVAAHTL